MSRVVVVGAGIAGTAAALTAAKKGAEVTVIAGPPGASVLAGGAKDDVPWESVDAGRPPAPLDARSTAVLDALRDVRVSDGRALVVAMTGLVRPARAIDAALLDVGALGNGVVLVPESRHGGWDAHALARDWSAAPRAKAAKLRFEACPATLLRRADELAYPDVDMARLHDDDERVAWLGDRLRDAIDRADRAVAAVVLPPWLGVARERASALSLRVGRPCGEALSSTFGASGLRFEQARDRAFGAAGVVVVSGRASRVGRLVVGPSERAWRVTLDVGSPIDADAVVLATGGLVGGGFTYMPASSYFGEALPDEPHALLSLACDAPVRLGARGRPLAEPSSLFGAAPETLAWPHATDPLLDYAGILVHEGGEVKGAPPGLFATGEVAADLPRTWLAALAHGARAGEEAA